jgi:hypothetical protein
MSPNRRGSDAIAVMGGRKTSPCVTLVLNLGNSPLVPRIHIVDSKQEDAEEKSLPAQRDERESRPSHRRNMPLLSIAVIPEERAAFRQSFWAGSKGENEACCETFCQTPISVIAKAFECEPFQLCLAANMLPKSRIESKFLNEFYIMDAVLNRRRLHQTMTTRRGIRTSENLLTLTTTLSILSCRTRRKILVRRRIICIELQFCSYLNAGYSTVIGNIRGEKSVCRVH